MVCVGLFTFTSCSKKSECQEFGRKWIDATEDTPKTCSRYNATSGKSLSEMVQEISTAFANLKNNNYTLNSTITASTAEAYDAVTTTTSIKLEKNNNYALINSKTGNVDVVHFHEIVGNTVYAYLRNNDSTSWTALKSFDVSDNQYYYQLPLDVEFTINSFEYNDNCYEGNLEELTTLYSEYLYSIAPVDQSKEDDLKFTEFKLYLDNENIKKVVYEVEIHYYIYGYEYMITQKYETSYSNIGTTEVLRPSNLPE